MNKLPESRVQRSAFLAKRGLSHSLKAESSKPARTESARSGGLKAIKGFTLVEMIVSIAIFMFVMVIAVGSLVAIVGANRKAQAVQAVVDNLRFALDDMSRVMRTGTEYHCSSSAVAGVRDCMEGNRQIAVINQYGEEDKVVFRFSTASECNEPDGGTAFLSGCLMRSTEGGVAGSFLPLTSPEIEIEVDPSNSGSSRFYVQGSTPGDGVQPELVMTLSAKITKGLSQPTELHLQTTVTQRVYDN